VRKGIGKSIRFLHDENMRDDGKRRYVMGDKGKRDKEKGRKQNTAKQKQNMKKKIEKQPKRTP
jgi:hypothetical protein